MKMRALVAGELLAAAPGTGLPVEDPSTGLVIGEVPDLGIDVLDHAVAAAARAQPGWAADHASRRSVLRRVADVLESHAEELGALVCAETGKSALGGRMEAVKAAEHLRWMADVDLPHEQLVDDDTRTVLLEHRPIGVVAAILPWNAPLIMAAHKAGAALRTGNTLVLKPSPHTPLATLRLAELVADIVPAGVLNVVTGRDHLGPAMTGHPQVGMVAFTGSVRTGRAIMVNAAASLKRLTLELGGNDAAIVLADADPSVVGAQLFRSAFMNSGQVCQAIKRLYVAREVYDAVVAELVKAAEAARLGGPTEDGATFGPLTTAEQLAVVAELVEDARARGGQIRTGGAPADRAGHFYPPTVVTGLEDTARLVAEEQFGPALPVLVFDDVAEAVERANSTEFGLSASVWTSDPVHGAEVAEQLVAGSVWVNRHAGVEPHIPFGGMRQSGIGRESGLTGLLAYTETRTIEIPRS
ncbi:aldehyde dehydrogenase family protein [Nocardioides sp. W7]|uniref:aldehyde dehydrogenase family protein n=1 Tax=Nocardioides sp. W7 TaxID=2931390 RepID=UPI001FD1286C|nr:aldehyde dehydrogenase family protein [Nocardioides sp. W7]